MTARPEPSGAPWLAALRWYLPLVLAANLVWETVQLPLYTLWRDGTAGTIAFAVVHCTAGDLQIALSALMLALALWGTDDWPNASFGRVTVAATVLGVVYTIASEWVNTTVRQNWAYAAAMPTVPVLGTGLTPLLQWLLLPPLCLLAARGAALRSLPKERPDAP